MRAFLLGAAATVLSVAVARAETFPAELVEAGRYLAIAGDCTACHTRPGGGQRFAGGSAIASPLGAIYASNITPSVTAGIGGYSEAQFARAMRQGVAADGRHLYPAMPYTAYTKLSDADIHALYAYFMRGVAPVDAAPPQTHLPFPFSQRWSMVAWNALFLTDSRFKQDESRSAQWNRGAYLAEALEHCSACHTPRNFLLAERMDRAYGGAAVGPWYAPNVTSDRVSGIGGWSHEELVQYLKTGAIHPKNQAAGGMAEAVANSLQYLTQPDLDSLATYLQTVPAIREPGAQTPAHAWGGPDAYEATLRGGPTPNGKGQPDGAALYSGLCASCHGRTGAGSRDQIYPALFHNTATGARRADNLVAAILFGVDRNVGGHHAFMPDFGARSYVQALSDAQVVAVSTYVVRSFGDSSVTVTADAVAAARAGGPPAPLAQAAAYLPLALPPGVLVILGAAWVFMRWRRRA